MGSIFASGRGILVLGVLTCALAHSGGQAIADEEGKESLGGLRGVRVEVAIDDVLIKAGMDPGAVRSKIELRLRQSGLVVMADTASYYEPRLWLIADVVPSKDQTFYGGSVDLSVRQTVLLSRKGMILPSGKLDWGRTAHVRAETWSAGYRVIWGRDRVRELSREMIDALLDEFLNDYLAANPKPAALEEETR